MYLIADTNVVVGELLRTRGRYLLEHQYITWFVTEEIASEVHHEVRRRLAAITARHGTATAAAAETGADMLQLFDTITQIVPQAAYEPLLPLAAGRIGDPDDQPTVALALTINAGIWTLDRDFFGIGLPVWSTDVLLRHVATSDQ
jgi:predicted nucleic acid-binding protein